MLIQTETTDVIFSQLIGQDQEKGNNNQKKKNFDRKRWIGCRPCEKSMLAITNNGHKQTESREIRERTKRTTYGQQIGEIGRRSWSEKVLRVILPVNNYMHAAYSNLCICGRYTDTEQTC